MFGQASHILYTLIATLPILAIIWSVYHKLLIKDWEIIGKVLLSYFPLLFVGDIWAISHHVWAFSPEKITNVWVGGALLDDLVFGVMVTVLISSVTLVGMHIQDQRSVISDQMGRQFEDDRETRIQKS